MDQLTAFLQDRWIVIVVALVVLFLVIKIVKTVVKWVIVLAVLAGLFYYGASYTDKLKELGTEAVNAAKDAVASAKDEALQKLAAKDAKYTANADGSYTVIAGQVKLEGKPGVNEVSISVAGTPSFKIPLDDAVKAIIEGAKKNG
ncbi:hypothetical protein [Paenibacillus koleovorans]|uniref:hypothetical protein n=1 Tax=Paenibacillus koleovorans TaxID=121608 RepID=UPI000FDBE209|nr:hypothetical protein [Paenibacillus koleovorans]